MTSCFFTNVTNAFWSFRLKTSVMRDGHHSWSTGRKWFMIMALFIFNLFIFLLPHFFVLFYFSLSQYLKKLTHDLKS